MKHNLYKMMGLDLYLSSLRKSEYVAVALKVKYDPSRIKTPLMSWDVYSQGYVDRLQEAQRTQDIIKVKSIAEKLDWQNNIDSIFKDEAFEAIVITDLNQRIVWVNKGFSKMTGYSKMEVLNKTPKFLQGPKTSTKIKQKIKRQLEKHVPFKEVVTNYKKNGNLYECEVKIFPLSSNHNNTHFIALERQVG